MHRYNKHDLPPVPLNYFDIRRRNQASKTPLDRSLNDSHYGNRVDVGGWL